MKTTANLQDVIAVNISNKQVRVLKRGQTERNAEAIVEMAVIRRGVEEEFFTAVDAGEYSDGMTWAG